MKKFVVLIYVVFVSNLAYGQDAKLSELEEKLIELIKVIEEKYPENSEEKIFPYNKAAGIYREIDQPARSITLYEKVLSIQKTAGKNPIEIVETMSNLSTVYAVVGEYKKALDYISQYSSLLMRHQPNSSEAIYTAMNNIATMNLGLENYKEAEKAYFNILALSKTTFNAKPRSIASTHHNLGVLYVKTNSFKKAEKSLLVALKQKKNIFGEKHREVGMTLSVLSKLYRDMGRISESKETEKQSLELLGYDPFEQ